MASVRGVLRFLKLTSNSEDKGAVKDMVSSMITTSRVAGSANFFLNGKVVKTDKKTGKMRLVSRNRRKASPNKMASASAMSKIHNLSDSFEISPGLDDSFIATHQIKFHKSLHKLKTKVYELCQEHSNIPEPSITFSTKNGNYLVEIPLL